MISTRQAWKTMEALRRDLDRAFANAGFPTEPFFRTAFLPGRAARHYPLINLYEDADHIYVEALAPGLDAAALDLAVIRNLLTISGETQPYPETIKPEVFHRHERPVGKFVRTIELPVEVDADQVKAEYKQGLLTVTLPKAAAAKPKQISVQVA
jgi:HSP20 family protein